MKFINLADLKDPNDPHGRSYRQVNAEKSHKIPLGSLVELEEGVRLFVVYMGRDCDQTPLYWLCDDPEDTKAERDGFCNRHWRGGYPEDSLTVVTPGQPMDDDPELDGTDAAHPAWWRGQQYGFDGAMRMIERALTERPAGVIGNERWQALRERIYAMASQRVKP